MTAGFAHRTSFGAVSRKPTVGYDLPEAKTPPVLADGLRPLGLQIGRACGAPLGLTAVPAGSTIVTCPRRKLNRPRHVFNVYWRSFRVTYREWRWSE